MGTSRFASSIALLTGLACAVPAHAAQTVIDRPPRVGPIAAHGRMVAYSAWDASIARYRLRVRTGSAAPHDVPVAPRTVPFDVSVARAYEPVKGHEDVVVYSRCRQEPTAAAGIAPESNWRTARGCALYSAPFRGPERRLTGTGEGVLPSVSGSTLAYARFGGAHGPRIVVRRLDQSTPPVLTFGGPSLRGGAQGPAGVAVFGSRVAVTWRSYGHSEGQDSRLLVADGRTARITEVRRRNGGGISGHAIVGATWLPGPALHWGEICAGDPGGCPGSVRYARWTPGGSVASVAAPLGMRAFAAARTTAWTLRGCAPPLAYNPGDNDAPCDLVAEEPPPLVP